MQITCRWCRFAYIKEKRETKKIFTELKDESRDEKLLIGDDLWC